MRIALEPEQVALKEELQGYFAELVTPEVKAGLASATGEFGEAGVYKGVIRQLGTDGWLGIGWPEGVRRPGPLDDRAADLHRRRRRLRRADPLPDAQHRRADDHALRHRRAEGRLPAQDPRGRPALLDRLLRARLGHRPGLAEDQGGPRGRRVGHQRPEDVDLADPVRRLDLARLPHRPGPAPAQGPVDDPGPGGRPGLLVHAGAHGRRRLDQRDVLRGRPGPGRATWSASSTAAGR